MKEDDTQMAAMLSLDVQSRFDVRFIVAPFPFEGVKSPSEWIGRLSNPREPEKRLRGVGASQGQAEKWLTNG